MRLPAPASTPGEVDAARESQLVADLVERDRLAEPHDNRLRLRHRRDIERNDQPLTRIKAHGAASSVVVAVAAQRAMKRDTGVSIRAAYSLCHEPGGIDELAHQDLELIGRARVRQLSISSKACSALGTVTCSASTKARQPTASTWRSASNEWVAPEWPDEAPPSAKTRF